MSQYQLFSGSNKDDSYGLEIFQFYNWGTYDGEISEIRPNLLASWLTGLNGAGKSTVLDGISTLLTPPARRQYNMSSGAEKAERTEKSYVRGAWGEKRDVESQQDEVKYLRGENSYTVLLGKFRTAKTGQILMLGQVLWLSNDKVNKIYITSTKSLDITSNLTGFDSPKALRAMLKDMEGIKTYETFQEYSACFIKIFGMRSTQAVELINKTASMKEVESLTGFMRAHMLDRVDMNSPVRELINHFKVAEDAHKNFEKARIQTEILSPLELNFSTYKTAIKKIQQLDEQLEIISPYISNRLIDIYEERSASIEDSRTILGVQKKEQEINKKIKEEELRIINQQLSGDKTAHAIALLEQEQTNQNNMLSSSIPNRSKYNKLIESLELESPLTASQFLENRRKAGKTVVDALSETKSLETFTDKFKIQQNDLGKHITSIRHELEAIEKKPTNIPSSSLNIRATICNALSIPEEKMPFIGELIKVNDKAWEGAAERLLRSFGLLILVDDPFYDRVVKFVNNTNLKGKLEFEKVDSSEKYETSPSKNDNLFIYSKIDIKNNTVFKGWITFNLKKRFNYVCCQSVDELMSAERGLTKEGFVKHNQYRHLKDDRHNISNPANFILGWSNTEKINILKKQIKEASVEYSDLQNNIAENLKKISSQNDLKTSAEGILHFDDYVQIDTITPEKRIEEIKQHIKELEASNQSLQKIRKKEQTIILDLEKIKQKIEEIVGDTRSKSDSLERILNEIQERKIEITNANPSAISLYFPLLDNLCEVLAINFTKDKPDKIREVISKKNIDDKIKQVDLRNSASSSTINIMKKFKDLYPQDSNDLLATLDFAESFLEVYNKLIEDDLPRFETEYRKMFTKDVLDRVTLLHSELYKRDAEIKEAIEFINTPLDTVMFNPGTKIRILAHSSEDRLVKQFQLRLRDCLPKIMINFDQGQQDEAYNKVKDLVEYLQSPTTERERNKVLDVRNWVEFGAEEISIESSNVVHYYSGAAARSGGQKAQLAFTVLASALAYQCGLTQDSPSSQSFNFVMVDEAFAKTDSKKSDMALKLFKNMGFQILVSSPDRDGDIVEPHIDCVHIAYGNQERNHSRIYTVSLEEASKKLGRKIGKKTIPAEVELGKST